ncbi:RsiV family protein [uncultured Fretibacterium sp.]|uniref:RsiV family protein n=1 Tax=uncultured Fretibacterium sp. TaxID=1678694 RepID=UPI0026384B30|nr:RsiV family protein [uncultured Fretibacterium sp.]
MKGVFLIGSRSKSAAALLAAAAFLLGGGTAYAASPDIVPSLTYSMLTHQEEGFDASIQIPILGGTGSTDLEAAVNARSLGASVALYRDFMSRMAELKAEGSKNYALTAVSKVAAYGDGLLTLEHGRTESMASSETFVRYETIDLETGQELALSDLFKDDGYSKVLSGIVKAQMKEQMKKDKSKSYFLEELEKDFDIGRDQPFYIENGKLVLVFNQGTVAPYSMGTCTFVIPTKEIQGSLAQQTYLK